MKAEPRKLTRDEYIAEMERLYGKLARNWKVQCPVCGIIYSLGEIGQEKAEQGLWGCIGRINGKGGQAFSGQKTELKYGCDFAANGLFRSPWLLFEKEIDVGEPTAVMPIAPVEQGGDSGKAA